MAMTNRDAIARRIAASSKTSFMSKTGVVCPMR